MIKPEEYQVFLFVCPAIVPVQFAIHPWFVINKKGTLSRYEVRNTQKIPGEHWGFLYKNCRPPFQGIEVLPFSPKMIWKKSVRLLGVLSGGEGSAAQAMIEQIERSPAHYLYADRYALFGPNSNTYVDWILAQSPEFPAALPWNAIGKTYARKKKVPIGIVHGRFQPPHKGHIRYILAALARAEHVMIGICTPEVCTEEEAARTGYPCAPHLNPFSYEERAAMITAALDAEKIDRTQYSYIPFPSDYKNIEILLPKGAVFFMSVTGESDSRKIAYLRTRGFQAETVYAVPEGNRKETSGSVRIKAQTGDKSWEVLVPPAIAEYIKKNAMFDRLSILSEDSTVE